MLAAFYISNYQLQKPVDELHAGAQVFDRGSTSTSKDAKVLLKYQDSFIKVYRYTVCVYTSKLDKIQGKSILKI